MRPADKTKQFIKNASINSNPDVNEAVLKELLSEMDKSQNEADTARQPDIWRTVMKSTITKLTAAAVIIVTVVFLITFFDKAATPAYALEQTIEANHTVKTIQFRMFEGKRSIENNEFSDYWIKYNTAGKLSNLRCNERDKDGVRFTVWNEGIKKTWIPKDNIVIVDRQNNTSEEIAKKWEDFAKVCDPKLFLQWIYDQAKEDEEIDIKIDEPAEDSESIYVKATGRRDRAELVVDRKTKLVKKFSVYQLKKQQYKFVVQVEFLAYNQPIDPSRFELREIPVDAKLIDKLGDIIPGVGVREIPVDAKLIDKLGDIIPGVGVGDYTLGMSKDDVLKNLGEPRYIHYSGERYTLDNLPKRYYLSFEHISFEIDDDSVQGFGVLSSLYKFTNGLGVGDSEEKIKQIFGDDYQQEEHGNINYLSYEDKGLMFEIDKRDRTIREINIGPIEDYYIESDVLNPQEQSKHTIMPGVGIGAYTLGMSEDDVSNQPGQPEGMSFMVDDGVVKEISVRSPLYKFINGLGVGDSEEEIKQAFGDDFQLEEFEVKALLTYEGKGLQFEIDKKNRTIREIALVHSHGDRDTPDSRKVIMLSEQSPGPIMFPKIDRRPKPEKWRRGEMKSLPKYNPDSTEPFQVDLRSYDLSKLDLRDSIEDLMYADFDHRTVWPTADRMPEGFDRERIMELGKNPGLGVRKVHEQGITGRGIGIAIIDQPLLTEHQEYADRLKLYQEINVKPGSDPAMHGAAVASIALGKTVGVAPEADLYYIGSWTGDWGKGKDGFEWNFAYYAQAVRRILEINKQLPDDRKIRVISISVGWSSKQKGYEEMTAAVEEAKKADMLVVCSCIDDVHGFVFDGLSRAPLSDPDDFASCEPGLWLAKGFYGGKRKRNQLWVPMGSRTTAAPNGFDEYVFYRMGGWSWAIPYVAGVYALAAQVDPEIGPDRFWKLAMNTGRTVEVEHQGRKYELGPIADPVRLIRAIRADETATLNRRQSDTQPTETHRQTYSETQIIIPGQRVGDYTLGMSKDDVLRKLGEPGYIHYSGERYTLDDLPRRYFMSFGDISFCIDGDAVTGITALSPSYKFANGLGVGDSEDKIKQAFGDDFQLREGKGADLITYEDEGLMFEIRREDRTVEEINVSQITNDNGDSDTPDSDQIIMLSEQSPGPITFPKIDRKPKPEMAEPREMKTLPKYDPDLQVQGEYVGTIGGVLPVGVQVIALGKHEFEGVFFTGGLPGAGWDEGTVFHIKGKTHDGETDFHGIHGDRLKFPHTNFRGSIRDGAFTGEAQTFRNRLEDVTFRLTKVHRSSPTSGKRPPKGAIVLFDGSSVEEWRNGRIVDDRLLDVNTRSKRDFGSVLIHLEFRCPFMPTARGMGRGNSGVYVKNEWEVQIIDSFGWHHENRKFERLSRFGRCGGIHEMVAPRINMSFPPLAWQTYDIEFTMAKFDDSGKKIVPAMMTVLHNGVVIHDKYVLPRLPPEEDEWQERSRGPIYLQGHGSPVRYRNIWVVERE